jgi:hypothetical protein
MSISSGFWFLAGALCATALWLLLGRGWQQLRTQSRWLLGGCVVAVFAALALYSRLGSPRLLATGAGTATVADVGEPHAVAAATAAGASSASGKEAGSMEAVVAALE